MRRILTLLVLACVVTAGVPASAVAAPAGGGQQAAVATENATETADGTATVTVLSYNDVQTAAAQDGDFSRLVELVHERRQAHDNPTVVLGAGDQVSPHALAPVSQWRVATSVLNHLDPAADVVGNHELDFGYDAVSEFRNDSEFPWLATNVVRNDTGEPFQGAEDHVVVERDGVRIGVIGLVDRGATYGKTNIDFAGNGVTVRNVSEAGPEAAARLRAEENVDVVVALAHTGIGDAERVARADDGNIDVILVGDDEQYYPPAETSGTIISEAEARAEWLGELNLTVDTAEDDVTAWNGRLINVTESAERNETASRIINGYRDNVSLDSTAAYSEVALDARFSTNYHRESNYGNLVTDAMRNAAGADVAITNAGGIRSNAVYGPGNITGGDVFNTLPFANTLVTVELTGEELEETLESQVITVGPDNPYDAEISQQVSGVSFEWNGATGEVRDLRVGGKPVRDGKTYTVAVNSYIAAGGSGYPLENATRVSTTDTLLAEVVIDYMEAKGTVSPTVEGRAVRYTTALPDRMVWVDEDGTTAIRYDVPENATGIAADSFYATNGTARVAPEKVYRSDGELVVAFHDAKLNRLADGQGNARVELYGTYTDARYTDDRSYWDGSVVSGDLTVLASQGENRGESQGNKGGNADA
ncbi:bifunctional metallophosphatase/5'-nucleotidase [Halorarius halobius]|uniref:bifunctional metallophosphatase/5'-nucleotidase n=1 Tax=Halorarius halobius TaxID=2962671 RepID=UPI0020CF2192|nr:5'-nucleotidase C-terminal domain-containing protein [Halorarius halobius]